MNETTRLKLSLLFAIMAILVCGPMAAGTVRHAIALPSLLDDSPVLVGSTETLLPDGRLLITGGVDGAGQVQNSIATRDPITGAITPLGVGLLYPRAAHTATVLPDGTVLVLGGVGQDGKIVPSAEVFDPTSTSVRLLSVPSPTPRAFHTATLLTDGRVLIAGGLLINNALAQSPELWDPRAQNTAMLPSQLLVRRNHAAVLLADGRVLFSGGVDANGSSITQAQVFDPQTLTVSVFDNTESVQTPGGSLTEMQASSPQDGAQQVALNALVAMRFSRPVQMASVSAASVTLQGPSGLVAGKVIAAEGGMLAFITPSPLLLPGTTYTVQIAGVLDNSGQNVAYSEFAFSTSGGTANPFGDEEWSPSSDWRTHRPPSQYENLPDLQAPRGSTALVGQVLKLNGEPLEHVTLELGNRRTQSDSTGRFILTDIPAGHQVLIIEGATANSPGKRYGRFEFGDEIKAGVTNKLDFKIWMSLLDVAHEITIPSPTKRETILTTPTMPGLELRLPAGTVITDSTGKVVTKITITPIPLDRPPFPLPFVVVPTYFTIQPGGAYISVNGSGAKGARLFYPNSEHKNPGVPYAFWNYNPDHNGWYVYGDGHVNNSGTQVVPDPGVVIYDFSGAMVGSGPGPTTGAPAGNRPGRGGDPVDLSTGLFIYNKTDLALSDVIPITLTRTYRPNDSWSRPFGIGASHPYEMFITGDGNGFETTAYVDLVLPDGTRIHFVGVGSAPPYATYLHSAAGTPWYNATISGTAVNPNNYPLPGTWQLQTKDGTIYSFPSSPGLINPGCQALVGITDRYGNQIEITRNNDANCTIAQITSPSGRYIQFQYDSSYRIKMATDNMGRQVSYTYYPSGTLWTVTDANGGVWTYNYDSQNRMTTIEDPRQITYLTNSYTSAGMVYQQYLADQTSFYQFNWTTTSHTTNFTFTANSGSNGPPSYQVLNFRGCTTCNEGFVPLVSQVNVIDPRGYTRQVTFNQNGYTSSDARALGQPEQETTTYTYYADNLINTTTDQLGRVNSYSYDVNDNLTSLTLLSGTSSAVTYSAEYDGVFSNPVTLTDPLGNTTSIGYDTYGNATSVTDPLGHQTTYGHNGMGLVTSITDAMQDTTQFTYDFADLTGITDPLLNTTTMFKDGAGRLAQRTDPLGHTTKYLYNNYNQLTQVTDALQGITTLTYDPNGNLQTVQDARQQGTNNKTVYTYDVFDHLQTRTDPLLRQESYIFDQLNNLTNFTDRRGKVAVFQYDGINRRSFAGYGMQPGPTYESTINYSYDGGNRLTKVVDSTSGTITPGFDLLDRLTSEATPQGSVAYQYDNDSRLKTATVAGQSTVNYYFDNASRLYKVAQGSSTTQIGYDNANRRQTLTLPNGIVLTYGYDNDSRITGMTYQLGTTTAVGSLSYQYDAAGHRTQVAGSLAATGFPSAVGSAAYDVANELTGWNGTTIGYDLSGNIANDGVAAYTWNARNQLVTRGTTNLEYDSFGRRVLNAAGNNVFYEGWNPAQQISGTNVTENRILGGIDEFFNRTDATGAYSPITDVLGGVLALTNSSGNITAQYGYDPYGNTTSSGGTSTNVFQYTGRENDNNGLYFYRARYYSPTFGRFISEDPIGFKGGINFYAYARDNPINFADPSGRVTANLGGAGNCTFWGISFGFSAGFVVDSQGNVGAYQTPVSVGGGAGSGCSFGLSGGGSTAHTICDFGGPFVEYSANAGLGAGAGASGYTGSNSDGTPILGGSVTAGIGGGADASIAGTVTSVTPLAGRKTSCPNVIPPIPIGIPQPGPWRGDVPTMNPNPEDPTFPLPPNPFGGV